MKNYISSLWFLLTFITLFISFGGITTSFSLRRGYELGDTIFAVGAFLFLYAISKVYFYFLDLTKISLTRFIEIIFVPIALFFGVKHKFLLSYQLGVINVVGIIFAYLLLLDINGKVRAEIYQTFMGHGWTDALESKLLFSRFPPKEYSDMMGANILYILLVIYLFV